MDHQEIIGRYDMDMQVKKMDCQIGTYNTPLYTLMFNMVFD